MRILIIGNLGYIGPVVVSHFREKFPESVLAGYDTGYFEHLLTVKDISPEIKLNYQIYADVRDFDYNILKDFDSIIYLAAISNDPMGDKFGNVTKLVNNISAINIAKEAKKNGISNFTFASSCSVYGFADGGMRNEKSELNPLTTYAKSKIGAEKDLESLSDDKFKITCLRFATACGFSPRLRLDLVLNDFVANAYVNNRIDILSDGTPWRPLIHVKDMAKIMEWSITERNSLSENFLAINSGSNGWNYQIKDLAYAVKEVLPEIKISINENAEPDKRSYSVDFTYLEKLAPDFIPTMTLSQTVEDLLEGLRNFNFSDSNFRSSNLLRLNVLTRQIEKGRLNDNLEWHHNEIS